MTTDPALVLSEIRNHVGYLTINRPAAYNAINLDVARLMLQQMQQWADNPDIKAVALRGSGDKAFCAGGDIRELYSNHLAGSQRTMAFFEHEYQLTQYIHDYSKPVIAYSNGLILGGGMGVFQGASYRVIGNAARLGMPEVAIGYFPDVGGSYFLSRLTHQLGTYLAVTGNMLGAKDAIYCGLADWLLDDQALGSLEQHLDQLSWSDDAHTDVKQLLSSLSTTSTAADSELQQNQQEIARCFAHSHMEEIMACLGASQSQWAAITLDTLNSRSPMAMVTALELQRRATGLSLSQCLAMELQLIRKWFDQGDFIEGVRALLIDKDKNPQWKYQSVADVPDEEIKTMIDGS